jgi:hypothetical protein
VRNTFALFYLSLLIYFIPFRQVFFLLKNNKNHYRRRDCARMSCHLLNGLDINAFLLSPTTATNYKRSTHPTISAPGTTREVATWF